MQTTTLRAAVLAAPQARPLGTARPRSHLVPLGAARRRRPVSPRAQAVDAPAAPSPAPAGGAPKAAEVDHVPLVLEELRKKKRVCIAQTAPAVRIAIGEELGLPVGTNATGKMVSGRAGRPWMGGQGFKPAPACVRSL